MLIWNIGTYCTLLKRMQQTTTAGVESPNTRDKGRGKKHIDPVETTSVYLKMT